MKKGFTIIEMIVVMAIFLFIIGAGIGIFISIVQSQKRILQEQQLLNQISYIEEYMSKAIRMAKTAAAEDGSCLQVGNIYELTHQHQGITFINQSDNNVCQQFYFDSGVLYEKKGDADRVALSSENIKFDSENPVKFLINDSNSDDYVARCSGEVQCVQPRVTILLNVEIPTQNQVRPVQTTVSRRNLNVLQ